MGRKRFSEREVIETLLHHCDVKCYRCGESVHKVVKGDGYENRHHVSNMEREHLHEVALGGADEPENCRYSCKWSHSKVTNGTPATSAGSSKHRIAKTKGTRAEKFSVRKLRLDKPREPRRTFGNTTFARRT